MILNKKLLSLRKKSGMSQEELAAKLGVTRQSVSRWEIGTALPDAQNIQALSKIFSVSADFLLNDEEEEDAPQEECTSISAVHATPRQIKCTVYEASPRKAAIYNFLTTLPAFFVVLCIDYPITIMLMCWICALLACTARLFNAKTASFSQTPPHLQKRHFLMYIFVLSALCAFTVLTFLTFISAPSELPINVILCLFLLQIYEAVSLEVSLYTPGDNSPALRNFRIKFYSAAQWLCAPAVSILISCGICMAAGFESFELWIIAAVFAALLLVCAVSTAILTRRIKK